MTTSRRLDGGRLYYGWYIVLAYAVMQVYGAGVFYYGISAFFTPIVLEFGWTRAATSFAISLYQLSGAVLAPTIGLIFDRVGPRKLIGVGVGALGGGFLLLSRVNDYAAFCAAILVIGFGFTTGFANTAMATVANWFIRRRALALGLLMAGAGLGGTLVPLLVAAIGWLSWRGAALAIGLGAWVLLLPLGLVIRHRPEQYGWRPDGDPAPAPDEGRSSSVSSARPPEVSFTIAQAIRTRPFWLCALSFSLGMATQYAIVVHTIPYLISIGQPESVAGLAVAWLTTSSLAGRLVVGWLADRFQKRHLLAALFALQAAGTLVFATMTAPWQIAVFLLLYAPAYGGIIPLRPATLADYFGRRSIGAVQGAISGFTSLAAVVGPVFAGWTFDVTQSYRTAYVVLGIITAAALPFILALEKPGASAPVSAKARAEG